MKLNEMNGAQLADVLCKIAPAVENITQDDEVLAALSKMAADQKGNAVMAKLIGGAYARLIPLLLKKHLNDTALIIAVLTGRNAEEVLSQNGFKIVKDVKASLSEELIAFFGSSVGMA